MPFRFLGGSGPDITFAGKSIAPGDVVTDDWAVTDERWVAVSDPGDARVWRGMCDQRKAAIDVGQRLQAVTVRELYAAASKPAPEPVPMPAPGVIEAINTQGSETSRMLETATKRARKPKGK